MSKDIQGTLILTPLAEDVLRAAAIAVSNEPDADTLLDMLGLAGVCRES